MNLNRILLMALICCLPSTAQAADKQEPPRSVIFDTDMLTDCDDAGALAMLHVLADRGEIKLLGVVLNGIDTTGKHSGVVSAINTHFGRADLPIGVSRRTAETSPAKASTYAPAIWDDFPHDGKADADRPAAVDVYRQLLTDAADHSVTIISVGFLTNLEDLLRDEKGAALVASKVRMLVVMGGAYPRGKEYNFSFENAGKAASHVLGHWPKEVPKVFAGYELGEVVNTGKGYAKSPPSPMRRAYELAYDSLQVGRPSWDQTAVLFAARGLTYEGKTYFKQVTGGYNVIYPDGRNDWRTRVQSSNDKAPPQQAYLELATSPEELAAEIEGLMVAGPQER
jgi:inosine-uridine nucleoside N-ribohydrolase